MIPHKFADYDIYNNDGTIRYTRHNDGSVLLPSFVFLHTGEEVLAAFYETIGVTMPARPIGVPVNAFPGHSTATHPKLQVNEAGFIQLGDKIITKGGRTNLVELLEAYASATAPSTRADGTQWTGKIYLPSGQEISEYIYGWSFGAPLPLVDTFAPTKVPNVHAEQIGKTTSARITWDHAEDQGKGIQTYKVYKDGVLLGDIAAPSDVAEFNLSGYGKFTIEVEAVDVDANVGPRGSAKVRLTQLIDSEPATQVSAGGTTYYYQFEATEAPAGATAPTFLPAQVNAFDSVHEKWKNLIRIWFTSNAVSWSKPIEYVPGTTVGGGDNTTHATVEAGNIPVPYTTAQNPPADGDSADGDLLVQSFDDGLAYSLRTAPGTWTVQFTWEPTAGGIVNSLVSPYTDPQTWTGTAGLTTHMISNDANGNNELLGVVDAALVPHVIASQQYEDVTDSVGTNPEAPEQSEFLVYFASQGRRLPLPGDVIRYTSPTAQVLTYDVGWNGPLIEYRLRTASGGSSSGDRATLDVTGSGHTLTALDVGKPLSNVTQGAVFDDVNTLGAWVGVITDVPDTDHVDYAPPGSVINIPERLLASGSGNGATFDGDDDYFADNIQNVTGAFILRARVKLENIVRASSEGICVKFQAADKRVFALNITADNRAQFIVNSSGDAPDNRQINGSTVLNADQWYDLRAEFSPSSYIRLYVDDVLDGDNTITIPADVLSNATVPLWIGMQWNTSAGRKFHGQIASVEMDGVFKYDLTRKQGTTLVDLTGNGNNMTYQGADINAFYASVDWDVATELDGRYAYWDDSLEGYTGQLPPDSSPYATQVIYINSIANNLANITILDGE